MSKALLHTLGQSISFGRLSLLGKVLWPMLLAASDDQGRGIAEVDVIKWHVCPNVNELTNENISDTLGEMVTQGMIHLYRDEQGQWLYQIIRWWEYQQMQWARVSKYQAPDNWTDRVRANLRGNEYVEDGWDCAGGFSETPQEPPEPSETPPTEVPTLPPTEVPTEEPTPITQPNLTQPNLTKEDCAASAPKPPPPPPKPSPKQSKQPTPAQEMFSAVAALCQIDLSLISDKDRGKLNTVSRRLREGDKLPQHLDQFRGYWYAADWRGVKGQAPAPHDILSNWGRAKEWLANGGQNAGRNERRSEPIDAGEAAKRQIEAEQSAHVARVLAERAQAAGMAV